MLRLLRIGALALLATASSCLAPPVVMKSPDANLERALRFYPAGSERVEFVSAGGTTLRGVFTPSGENSPVVLHLVGASQSCAALAAPFDPTAQDFANLGYASLVCDYSGVGVSEGSRHVRNLASDARAMWEEAVRRAGGDESQVLVRATSLGAIATALLLRDGARPGGVMLVAPVFPDSIVQLYARDQIGVVAGWYAALMYAPVARVDVCAELERSGAPLCVSVFRGDSWSPQRDLKRLREVAQGSTPNAWIEESGDHIGGVLFAQTLAPEELSFLRALDSVKPDPPRTAHEALAQLDPSTREVLLREGADGRFVELAERFALIPAAELAASALEHEDRARAEWIVKLLHPVGASERPLPELRALYSLAGDDADLLSSTLALLAMSSGDAQRRHSAFDSTFWDQPIGIAANAAKLSRASPRIERKLVARQGTATIRMTPTGAVQRAASDHEYRRLVSRAALKLAGYADRVTPDGGLEYLRDGEWTALPFE